MPSTESLSQILARSKYTPYASVYLAYLPCIISKQKLKSLFSYLIVGFIIALFKCK